MLRVIKILARYLWTSPNTLLGIAAAIASFSVPKRAGCILTCRSNRGFARWFLANRGYCAVTLGHLVLMTGQAQPDVIYHEMVHVHQEERWGPLFLPVYCLSMLTTRLRGKDPYWDNPFEVEARLVDTPSTPSDRVS